MIKNEREYRITTARAMKFADAIAALRAPDRREDNPALVQLQLNALMSQLEELQDEIREYERLKGGEIKAVRLESFEDFPRALIQGRIAAGLTQKELADRLGIAEQQVQRYEATDYASSSLSRVKAVAEALKLSMREDVFFQSAGVSTNRLLQRTRDAGIEEDFLRRRLFDDGLGREDEEEPTNALRLGAILKRVFAWDPVDLFGSTMAPALPAFSEAPRYKLPAFAQEAKTRVLTGYTRYIARLIIKATPSLVENPLPLNAEEVREELLSNGEITLESLLTYVWRHGVPVLPLYESGGFHGAFWRLDGRSVIVLKQKTRAEARWMHDLLHEAYHAGKHAHDSSFEVLDSESGSIGEAEEAEEKAATRFAGNVLLGGLAEKLADDCVKECSGRLQWLKKAVPVVASRYGFRADVLANYMAFRLALQGENWWGAANNLQVEADPWKLSRDFLLGRLDLSALDSTERELLRRALNRGDASAR